MSQTDPPGNDYYHRVIRPKDVELSGSTHTVNKAVEGVRNQLHQALGRPGAPRCNVHILISVDEVTDSAGAPLMTRRETDR